MLDVEQVKKSEPGPSLAASVATLLEECSAITDYRTLRDSLPRRLAALLRCRCVLLYQKVGETLQFAAGTYDDKPGWSAALLSVVHINPIALNSDVPEAQAWRTRATLGTPAAFPVHIASPLMYRQRCTGVLVALRSDTSSSSVERYETNWTQDELQVVAAVAGVVALLLENTRLLERDRERVNALSLLTTMSSQMTYSLYEMERLRELVMQHVRDVARVDLCAVLDFANPDTAEIAPELCASLLAYFSEQHTTQPLVLERPGDGTLPHIAALLHHVPPTIKTFFAFPLLRTRPLTSRTRKTNGGKQPPETSVLGVIIGGYHHAWKLRREESLLLQVVASQASAVLENMHLVTEVTEARNQARKLLRQVLEDQRLKELILKSMPSGLITIDMSGNITTYNHAAETILGYQAQKVVGKQLHGLLHMHTSSGHDAHGESPYFLNAASFPLRNDALHCVLTTGKAQSGTLITTDQHGQELVLDMDIQSLCDNKGRQVGALTTFSDVTSVHRLEEEKRRLDRLASLGEMAANVAHEVRNPLASIKTSIQMLMDDLVDDVEQEGGQPSRVDMAQESTLVMLQEVERLDAIVRDMLLFAKPRQLHRATCDLLALSDHVLHLMQAQYAAARVTIERDYATVPALWVDMGQLEQVLFNLYTNALQATAEGGTVTIACRMVEEQGPRQKQYVEAQHWLELAVTDTGVGISADALERIFQPFFTTKAHGIGLGLPITRRFIEDHGGVLQVKSCVGQGTTMTVRLPVLVQAQEEE